jgi:hypothetical protein
MPEDMVRAPVNPSYRDVIVEARGKRYHLFNCPFGLKLECDRVGGWTLWDMNQPIPELLGGEFDNDPGFRITVQGIVICGPRIL